jgi:hypothetical protein
MTAQLRIQVDGLRRGAYPEGLPEQVGAALVLRQCQV